ncbi:hypothetical protein A6F59_24480 [Prescottella equi]|nr:hypothetical protein A6F59_24480 [Prescottella equi]
MGSNWISVIASAMAAAILSLFAAICQLQGWMFTGSVFFELGTLVLLHSGFRSVWITRLLLDLVHGDDLKTVREESATRYEDLFDN